VGEEEDRRVTTYLAFGATFAFAAAVQPGPLQTYLLARVCRAGWRGTLPAAFAPILSDGPIAVLALFVLTRLSPWLTPALQLAGGLFLLYLAARALDTWRHYAEPDRARAASGTGTLATAALVNFLNPNPYLGWSLVLGPLLLKAWREAPANGMALIIAFYGTMTVTLAGIILLFAGAAHLGPRIGRALVAVSVLALAAFGMFELWSGARGFFRG
jgi:threonine/homoserine/homoserine lactone efflux protein